MNDGPSLAIVVEDDVALRDRVSALLKAAGTQRIAYSETPDCARTSLLGSTEGGILVVGLGSDAGARQELIGRCRALNASWVILALDHRDDADSAADALAAGADDVLRVPFPPREFEARLALRLERARGGQAATREQLLAKARLTPVETEIMLLLLSRNGEIVTRNELARHVDNSDWTYGDRKFDVHVAKIRKKLRVSFGERYALRTIRSVGYSLQDCGAGGRAAR